MVKVACKGNVEVIMGSMALGVAMGSVTEYFTYYMGSCSTSNRMSTGLRVLVLGSNGGDHTSSPYHSLLRTIILNMLRYRSPPVRLVDWAKLCIFCAAIAAADLFFFKSAAYMVL